MKNILVTGSSSGIGKAITEQLIKAGYHVIGIARRASSLKYCKSHYTAFDQDLSSLDDLPSFLKNLTLQFPVIEGIVFNAAVGQFGKFEEFSYRQIQSAFELNLMSHLFLARAYVPLMKKQRKGSLIFIGSEAALQGKSQGTLYCAAKFAMRGFTQALREECRKSHIRVCLINPGAVLTPFFDALHFKPKDEDSAYCHPQEVASLIVQQLNTRSSFVLEEINLAPIHPKIEKKNKMALDT